MNQISVAGIGVYVSLIEVILRLFGITPEPGTVMEVVNAVVIVGGWILILVGQFKRSDLHFGLVRK